MNIILFGFKGSGKTTFGKNLAEEIGIPFIDLDQVIEKMYSITPSEIYQKRGMQEFRRIEKEALLFISSTKLSVISLGGGTVLDSENVKILLAMGQLIYLKTRFETIQRRIKSIPAFIDTTLEKVYYERIPIYESIPSIWIEND